MSAQPILRALVPRVPEPDKPRLLDRDRVRTACRVRHYSLHTESAYIQGIRRFILFHNKRHPNEMGAAEINIFLTDLAVAGNVAASTQNQAFAALLFLYQKVLAADPGKVAMFALRETGACFRKLKGLGSYFLRPHKLAKHIELGPINCEINHVRCHPIMSV